MTELTSPPKNKTAGDQDLFTIEFEVAGLPPSPNAAYGQHWSKVRKTKAEWVAAVQTAAVEAKRVAQLKGLFDQCHIDFQISFGDKRRHDPDNISWAVTKPTLDALKDVLLVDDNIDCIELSYSYDRSKPRRFRVTLTGR